MPLFSYTLLVFGSLFSIVDPFAAVPVFLGLTSRMPPAARRRTARRAALTCFVVLTTFGLCGALVFKFFGVTLPAFKIAGGILLFGVGIDMMNAKASETRGTPEEQKEAEHKDDVGLIPLGLPLLSGPGAIATVMVLSAQAKNLSEHLALCAATGLISLIAYLILRSSSLVARVFGQTGLNLVARIMGLILAAVAIQFVLDGVREAFPRWT